MAYNMMLDVTKKLYLSTYWTFSVLVSLKKVKFLVMNWMDMSIWIVFGHWKQVTTHASENVTLWIVIIGYVMFFSCFTVNLHCLSYYFDEIYAFLCVSLHFVFEITLHHKHLAPSVGNELWLAIPWSARVVIFSTANSDDEQPSIEGLVIEPS